MNEMILQVRSVENQQYKKIWIDPSYRLLDFINEFNEALHREPILNEVYLIEEKRFLQVEETICKNYLCMMDHLVVI